MRTGRSAVLEGRRELEWRKSQGLSKGSSAYRVAVAWSQGFSKDSLASSQEEPDA